MPAFIAFEAVGARITDREMQGEGAAAWEDIVFTLATDAPAAFRARLLLGVSVGDALPGDRDRSQERCLRA